MAKSRKPKKKSFPERSKKQTKPKKLSQVKHIEIKKTWNWSHEAQKLNEKRIKREYLFDKYIFNFQSLYTSSYTETIWWKKNLKITKNKTYSNIPFSS